jgi:hypothetical protein
MWGWLRSAARVSWAIVAALALTACHASARLLGWKWGDDAAECARQVGLTCDRWDPWIDPAFETSIDLDHPRTVLGAEGLVRLVRAGGRQLEGIQVTYRACARDDARQRRLREGLRSELHVQSPDVAVPYETWADNSLVHFVADPHDDTCTLTVAGPRFGKAFAAVLLESGVGAVGAAVGPR